MNAIPMYVDMHTYCMDVLHASQFLSSPRPSSPRLDTITIIFTAVSVGIWNIVAFSRQIYFLTTV